jgi:hypothetical protein
MTQEILIELLINLVNDYPNDFELGSEVRKLITENF